MESDFVRGNLNLLILSLLHGGPLHGLQVAKEVGALVGDREKPLSYGSVYPALHRLEQKGLIEGTVLPSEEGARPKRQYALTTTGVAELKRLQKAQYDFMSQLQGLWAKA